jgi:thiol-disulfide isomerase/thioredoxin
MLKIISFLLLLSSMLIGQQFALKTIAGEELHIEITPHTLKVKEFPNKVIMLDFFGANCPPCIAEMPELVKFQNVFGKSVQLIGIQAGSQRDDKEMQKFVQKHNINYPVVNLDMAKGLILYAQEYTGWNGALPYKLFYDFRGKLLYQLYGMMNWEKLTGTLHDL